MTGRKLFFGAFFVASLAALAALVWALWRRWNRRFAAFQMHTASVLLQDGELQQEHSLRVQSILGCSRDRAWDLVQTTGLLVHVAWPILVFRPAPGHSLPPVWSEGDALELRLFIFGLLPLGEHTIRVERIDPESCEIQTRESGGLTRRWDHRISLQAIGEDQTLYTDEVALDAGRVTPLVARVAGFFFRYRQTRWQRLAKGL
jgi:hypothetical protein